MTHGGRDLDAFGMSRDLDRKLQGGGNQQYVDEVMFGYRHPPITAGFRVNGLFQHLAVKASCANRGIQKMTVQKV